MRWILVAGLALLASGCATPPAPTATHFADGGHWVLNEPVAYRLRDTEHVITVPRGFVTDFSSVPRIAWAVMSPTDRHGRAGIIHDWLYWDQGCSQEQADKIMLLAMIESGVDAFTRIVIYWTLRAFGQSSWIESRKMRESGRPREISDRHLPIPAEAVWPAYREELYRRGERARPNPPGRPPPAYCSAVEPLLRR